jgi:2-octaprenyl-6-methoxyphenol hydroxylase
MIQSLDPSASGSTALSGASLAGADVVIVGGGLAGMTLACALGTAGVSTLVIDRDLPSAHLTEGFDGRTTAIAYGSGKVLEGAGVWAGLAGDAEPILDIRVTDNNAPLFLHYDHREVGDNPLGWIAENRAMRRALFARMAELPAVTHVTGASVERLERSSGGATIHLADGRSVTARLVVGADGRHSLCRADAGIRTLNWSYPQHAIACTIQHEKPHHGVAVEMFLPAGPFAMLPMTGQRTSIVWTERAALAPAYMALDEAAFTAELQRRCGSWLGAVTPVGPRFRYPLSVMHAERYIDRRLALISEASHAIHPIAGQGLNMGFRDVAALAEAVVDAWRCGLDVGGAEVLERYQRWRRADNLALVAVTDVLNRLFSNDMEPLRLARRVGLALVDRAPPLRPLKRLFMRHAMGVVGDLPRLIRGEPL